MEKFPLDLNSVLCETTGEANDRPHFKGLQPMPGLPTKDQIAKLIATGKVADVENEGMDEGRFFVHLKAPYTWDTNIHEVRRSMSFDTYAQALSAVHHEARPDIDAQIAAGALFIAVEPK